VLISIFVFFGTLVCRRFMDKKSESSTEPEKKEDGNNIAKIIHPPAICYFISIGISFMFIEVFFIHKLILPLGSAVNSFAVSLVVILISSGIGSYISSFVDAKKAVYSMVLLPAILVLYFLFFERVVLYAYSFLAIIPAGMLMGFFFPAGIRFLCKDDTSIIPLVYAANGAASVVAPLLASTIAVVYGLKLLLVLSFLLYGAALSLLCLAGHWDKGDPA